MIKLFRSISLPLIKFTDSLIKFTDSLIKFTDSLSVIISKEIFLVEYTNKFIFYIMLNIS